MVHFVCINADNFAGRGKDYVTILRDMIFRNIEEGTPAKFTVFTNDPEDYPDINKRPLEPDLKGWWNKTPLFKPGLFEDGERIIYIDLDVLIFGPLDEIMKYDGPLAALSDFNTFGCNSSVMMWEAGKHTEIWEDYEKSYRPQLVGGDQVWLDRYNPKRLQVIYPDKFCDYKKYKYAPPRGVSVIVFHGEPRPHEVDGWVADIWKVGGAQSAVMPTVGNTSEERIISNVRENLKLGIPAIRKEGPHEKTAVLVGGGPSLVREIEEIRMRQAGGQAIFAMNGSYKYLVSQGITPDAHIMLDARPENAEFVPETGERYYASQCDPKVFKHATTMWHTLECAPLIEDEACFVGFGSTVGIKALSLLYILGYRTIHLYGYDSSYSIDEHHAYDQPLNEGERTVEVEYQGRKYKCAPWMATQADDFKQIIPELLSLGVTVIMHGAGLIPYMAKVMSGNG